MPAAPALDKNSQALVKKIDELMRRIEASAVEAAEYRDTKGASEIRRGLKGLAAKLEEAKKLPADKAPAALKSLLRQVEAAETTADALSESAASRDARRTGQAALSASLMEWLLIIGKVDDPVLAKPMLVQQQSYRKQLDRIEKMREDDLNAAKELEFYRREVDKCLIGAREALNMGAWIRGTYRPAVARAEAAIKSVPDAGCRRTLAGEITRIEADKNKALERLDLAEAKGNTIAALQAIEKVCTRIRALSPAIDREFDRLEAQLAKAGKPRNVCETLRALRLHKAGGWPKGGSVDEIGRELSAFETAVARLAALAAKEVAAAEKAAKSA